MSILRIQHIGTSIVDFGETQRILEELGFATRDFRNDQGKGFQYDCRVLLGNECWLHIVQNWNPDSRVAMYLADRGQSLEHIAVQTDDIEGDVKHLRNIGIPIFEDTIFDANDGFEAFVYPDDGIGFTVELIQPHAHSWQYPEDAVGRPVSRSLGVRRASELGANVPDPASAAERFVELFRGVEIQNAGAEPRLRFGNDCEIRLRRAADASDIGLDYLSLESDSIDSDREQLDALSIPYTDSGRGLILDSESGLGLPIRIDAPS